MGAFRERRESLKDGKNIERVRKASQSRTSAPGLCLGRASGTQREDEQSITKRQDHHWSEEKRIPTTQQGPRADTGGLLELPCMSPPSTHRSQDGHPDTQSHVLQCCAKNSALGPHRLGSNPSLAPRQLCDLSKLHHLSVS